MSTLFFGRKIGIIFRHLPLQVEEMIRILPASGKTEAEQTIALYRREA